MSCQTTNCVLKGKRVPFLAGPSLCEACRMPFPKGGQNGRQDAVYLQQVLDLVRAAQLTIEEAEAYAEDIRDPEMKKRARAALDGI